MKYLAAVNLLLAVATAETYDYVIVGAGTAGLVIANRLSADPLVTVTVIDPGDDQRLNPNVSIPDNLGNPPGTDLDWKYKTVPQVDSSNRILDAPQGKAWGGSSAINGMTYLRGDAAVFDAWEKLGNKGWNWKSMLPYFKKSERFTPPNEEQIAAGATYQKPPHGYEGNIRVGYENTFVANNLAPPAAQTWEKLGYPQCPDFNAGNVRGYAVAPQTRDSEKPLRWDSVVSYYSPVEHRKNLKIIKGTVKRITWKKKTTKGKKDSCKLVVADGVEYLDADGKAQIMGARREVVVSAGALRSPMVLEGSGVGNPSILKNLGIHTVVDLPGVGENLVEQPGGVAGTLSDTGGAAMAFIAMATAKDIFGDGLDAYSKKARDQIPTVAKSIVDATPGRALSVKALEKQLRIQHDLLFKEDVAFAELQTVGPPTLPATFTQFWILFPFSRGSLHLGDKDEINKPQFDPRFFFTDLDLEGLTESGKVVQKFYSTSPMADIRLGPLPVSPYDELPDNATDAQMRTYLQDTAMIMNHQIGSMAMMSRDLGGVVDPDLKVYGTANVRVVDASVFPTQISGHLTAVIYAIAEKAADAIKKSQK